MNDAIVYWSCAYKKIGSARKLIFLMSLLLTISVFLPVAA